MCVSISAHPAPILCVALQWSCNACHDRFFY
jgi:hypothetical protein